MAIDSDKRRVIFNQVRLKAASRGMPIDDDPEFLGWVEQWIAGEYEISELKSRYNDLASRRSQNSRSARGAETRASLNSEGDQRLDTEAAPPQDPVRDAD